jgi:hypothetical protein
MIRQYLDNKDDKNSNKDVMSSYEKRANEAKAKKKKKKYKQDKKDEK